MLKYWYSPQCSRQIKLLICIATIAITFYCSEIAKLATLLTLFSLLLGMLVHLLATLYLQIPAENPYHRSFRILFSLTPWMGWSILFLQLPDVDRWAQAIQIVGFSLIGFYLVTIYANRAPRNSS